MTSTADQMKTRLRQDLQMLRAPQGYLRAGLPHYPGLFGRDSLIAAWQTLSEYPAIARATLLRLAKLQGKTIRPLREEEPGKIPHEYYEPEQFLSRLKKWRVVFRWGSPYYGSVDATPLWLMVLERYLQQNNDVAFRDRLWPAAVAAYQWLTRYSDHNNDGFSDYLSHNPRALTHQGWKDSKDLGPLVPPIAPVEVQGYRYAALVSFANLSDTRGEHEQAEESRIYAKTLQENFLKRFSFDHFFCFAIDGTGNAASWATSNPGHLLLSGILDTTRCKEVAERLFAEDFLTPYGIRTLSTRDAHFSWQTYHCGSIWPHDNWFFWKGLMMCGFTEQANQIREALFRAFSHLGGRIIELYAVDPETDRLSSEITVPGGIYSPCYPQAWASGALLDMLHETRSLL